MTDLRGSDTRTDEEAGFRFFETTINGIVWMSLCALYYSLFLSYGPYVLGTFLRWLGTGSSVQGPVLLILIFFAAGFLLWPLVSVALFFRSYMPKVVKAVDRPLLATVKLPDWLMTALFLGFLAGLIAFMIVLAGAAFYQSWLALGSYPISAASWLERLYAVLEQP